MIHQVKAEKERAAQYKRWEIPYENIEKQKVEKAASIAASLEKFVDFMQTNPAPRSLPQQQTNSYSWDDEGPPKKQKESRSSKIKKKVKYEDSSSDTLSSDKSLILFYHAEAINLFKGLWPRHFINFSNWIISLFGWKLFKFVFVKLLIRNESLNISIPDTGQDVRRGRSVSLSPASVFFAPTKTSSSGACRSFHFSTEKCCHSPWVSPFSRFGRDQPTLRTSTTPLAC